MPEQDQTAWSDDIYQFVACATFYSDPGPPPGTINRTAFYESWDGLNWTRPAVVEAVINSAMTAEEWNKVLEILSNGAFRVVAPLIQKITQQAEASVQKVGSRNSEQPVMVER